MAAGGGKLQRAPCGVLATDVAKILDLGRAGPKRTVSVGSGRGVAHELRMHFPQVAGRKQAGVRRELRFTFASSVGITRMRPASRTRSAAGERATGTAQVRRRAQALR